MADFEITKDLFKLQDDLKRLEQVAPGKVIEVLDKAGNKVRKEVRENTPVGTSKKPNRKRLKSRWKLDPTIKENGAYTKKLRSTAPHFHLVERGHNVVPRRVTKGRRATRVELRSGASHVPGTYFFEKTMDKIEPNIYEMYDELLEKTMKEVFEDWQ